LSHVYRSEFGGAALLSAVTTEPIDGERGIFTPQQIEAALLRFGAYGAIPRLLCIEQTHNYGGGSIWPLEQIRAVCKIAHERGLLTHMDGARLFSASVATGISVRDYAEPFDSVWIDLSKGLGCPIGAVLAGKKDFINRAWRFKHLFGGALRQSGIVAAAGIYALQHHIQRLREDHDNANLLAQELSSIKGIRLDPAKPETNIVFFNISQTSLSIPDFQAKALAKGVRFSAMTGRVRAVTHLDVARQDIEKTLEIVREIVS
jgi:threonine aldolase